MMLVLLRPLKHIVLVPNERERGNCENVEMPSVKQEVRTRKSEEI